jgi:hypothetical protein
LTHDLLSGKAASAIAIDALLHGKGSIAERLKAIGGELRMLVKGELLRKAESARRLASARASATVRTS